MEPVKHGPSLWKIFAMAIGGAIVGQGWALLAHVIPVGLFVTASLLIGVGILGWFWHTHREIRRSQMELGLKLEALRLLMGKSPTQRYPLQPPPPESRVN